MATRKKKYVVPAGTKFGELPKKVEEPPEEQTRRDRIKELKDTMLQRLGVNGFYFQWGYVRVDYNDLEPTTIDYLFNIYNQQIEQQGNLIAHRAAQQDFTQLLTERKKELEYASSPELRFEIRRKISALEALLRCKPPEVKSYIPPQSINDDTFEDLFPQSKGIGDINMNELSQDVIDLCYDYVNKMNEMQNRYNPMSDMETLDIERADLHNRLVTQLQENGIHLTERGMASDLAERVVKWHLPL